MNQAATNAPTSMNDQPRVEAKKTGKPTTNHTSRAENKNSRAAESQLMAALFDSRVVNLTFDLALPIPLGSAAAAPTSTSTRPSAIATSDPTKPSAVSSAAPIKNPAPFSAFFDPV